MKVFVHAYEYVNGRHTGGGGFDWHPSEAVVEANFNTAVALKDPSEAHFMFEFDSVTNDPDAIDDELFELHVELIDKATRRYVGKDVAAFHGWVAS